MNLFSDLLPGIDSAVNLGSTTFRYLSIWGDAVTVGDDAYNATTWDGNFTVPTKNAVRDKFEDLPNTYVDMATAQLAIGGTKGFTDSIRLSNVIQMAVQAKGGYASGGAFGYIGVDQYFFAKDTEGRGAIFDFSLISAGAIDRTYTFPNADGTLALVADLPDSGDYVDLTSAQTVAGSKTFTVTTNFDDSIILEPLGSSVLGWELRSLTTGDNFGFLVETGSGTGIYNVAYTLSGTGTPTATTDLTDKAYVDGLVSGVYLPLSGGTMAGTILLNSNSITGGTEVESGIITASANLAVESTVVADRSWKLICNQSDGSMNFQAEDGPGSGNYPIAYRLRYGGTPTANEDIATKGFTDATYSATAHTHTNYVTTDTTQSISGLKTFTTTVDVNTSPYLHQFGPAGSRITASTAVSPNDGSIGWRYISSQWDFIGPIGTAGTSNSKFKITNNDNTATPTLTAVQVSGQLEVSDDAYAAGWNGSLQVPTKNAVYDKIESLGAGSGTVTSVAATVPTGISISGSPITTAGTLAFTWTAGYQGYTTTEASKLAGIETGATADQAWGDITGTLASQTDLQSALDAKVDLAGDTMTGILTISPSTPNANPLRVDGTGDWSVTTVSRSYISGRDSTGDNFWYVGCASDVNNDVILYSYPSAKWLGIRANGEVATTATVVDFTTAALDVNDIRIDDIAIWYVSSADSAHQRADARDDATNFARLHWYGANDVGSTSNFRHSWYDGTAYVDVTAESGGVTFASEATTGSTFTFTSTADTNLIVEADSDNVTESDNPTIQMWQDGATVKSIWGIEGTGGTAFAGAAANSPYFDTVGASSYSWAINGTQEMSLNATTLDLGSNNLVVAGYTLENSTDRAGLLQITDSVTTRAYYGFQIKDDTGQLFSMMSNATVWGVYDDTNSKWGIQYNANSSVVLYFNANIKLATTTTGITVTGTGVATDWSATSDARLKTEILPLKREAPQVEWKQFHVNGEDRMRYGVIAQDVVETHPELITVDEDGFMALSYTDLLVLKMAEKDKQIEELTDRLDKLETLVQLMMK